MSDLAKLQRRLTAATGSDRELDGALWLVLDPEPALARCSFKGMKYAGHVHTKAEKNAHVISAATHSSPLYTSSIDAALGLVEKMLPGWGATLVTDPPSVCLRQSTQDEIAVFRRTGYFKTRGNEIIEGETLPLAILAAMLAALQSQPAREGQSQ